MIKLLKKFLTLMMGGFFAIMGIACGSGTKKLVLPKTKDFINTVTWNEEMMEAYLRPYWYSREIYNETLVFIGEEGEAKLMFAPSEIESVRNFTLDKTYTEGVDYVIQGNVIKRVKGSSMPYWEVDDFFLLYPNDINVRIDVNMETLDFDLKGRRYLRFGEGSTFTSKQIAVTYRHNELFDGVIPVAQQEKLRNVITKLQNHESINLMVYGDSVAVGCNASGTSYGGNINPHMPNAYDIVKQYLEKHYDAKITLENQAVGGWGIFHCLNAYDEKIRGRDIDLLIFRIGGNDGGTSEEYYTMQMHNFLDKFFAEYPNANVIIQTPETPNEQSTWTQNVEFIDKWTENIVKNNENTGNIAIADVQSFIKWTKTKGKRGRDWLANNINHSNDFVIRVYAQYILKTMLGDEYVKEIYK